MIRTASDHVSVILPFYNRAETLADAIGSVLGQSHQSLTLFLINDGSDDGSSSIARANPDSRIVHVDLDRNRGASHARNVGLAHAETDLVAFMDSDDRWMQGKLETQVKRLRQGQEAGVKVAIVGCGWRYLDSVHVPKEFNPGPFSRIDVLANRVSGMGTPKLLVDRSTAVAEARFDELIPSLEEGDYVMSSLANGSLLSVAPEILLEVRTGLSDHLAVAGLTALGWEAYLRKYSTEFDEHPALRAWYAFRAARDHLKSRSLTKAMHHAPVALSHHPVSRLIHLGFGVVGGRVGLSVAQRLVDATSPVEAQS